MGGKGDFSVYGGWWHAARMIVVDVIASWGKKYRKMTFAEKRMKRRKNSE